MKSIRLIALAVLVLVLTGLGQAATIALVSDAYAPGEELTQGHEDDTLVFFLEGLGYTVDTSGMGKAAQDAANIPALASADLVIVSRITSSGSYANNDDERKAWNELGSPLLLMSGYLTRDSRWGWTTGGSSDADKTLTDLEIIGAHPFLPVPQVFDWSTAPTAPEAPKAVYLPDNPVVAGGTVIANLGDQAFLIDIPAGTDFDDGNGTTDKFGVAGARRAFMAQWGYDEGDKIYDFEDYITDDYKDIFAGTIATMIPEPATLVLLGLGGILFRRRR